MHNDEVQRALDARELAEKQRRDEQFHQASLTAEAREKIQAKQAEGLREREQQNLLGALPGGMWVDCSGPIHERLRTSVRVRDYGVVEPHPHEKKLCLYGINDSLEDLCVTLTHGLPGAEKFKAAIADVKRASHKQLAANEERAKEARRRGEDVVIYHAEAMRFAEKTTSEKFSDLNLKRQQKEKSNQESEFDQGDIRTWSSLSEEGASTSKETLSAKILKLKEQEKECEAKDQELRKGQDSLYEEAAQLKAQRDRSGVTPEEDKDLFWQIDSLQRQAEKLAVPRHNNPALAAEARKQIDESDAKNSALECCLDRYALLCDALNWRNRTDRVIKRIEKATRERDELVRLQEALNDRWKKITGSSHDLVQPLSLKAAAKLYFI